MKLHKRNIIMLLTTLAIMTGNVYAASTPGISVMINGKSVTQNTSLESAYMEPKANRIMVSTRVVAQNMGFKVDWDKNTKKVTISNGTNTIVLGVNSNVVYVNGVKQTIDAKTEMKNDRIYVPVRFVSEVLGSIVNYNGKDKVITITTGTNTGGVVTTPSTKVTYDNMVAGKKYDISDVISNALDKEVILRTVSENGKVETIKVIKSDTVTGINYETGKTLNIKVDAIGWANDRKMSAALRVSNLEANTLRIYYLQNGKIIGYDLAPTDMRDVFHGKNYYLFGDGTAETPEYLSKATHLGIAAAYTGEMIIIENPNPTPILNIYTK